MDISSPRGTENRLINIILFYTRVTEDSTSTWSWFLCYLLTPCNRVLLEKLTLSKLVKKFPTFYGTRMFITALTRAQHLSLSWARSIQSKPPLLTSWRPIFILQSHLRLSLPSGLLPSDFPTKILYTSLLSLIRATWPAHLILLDLISRKIFCVTYRSFSSSLCSFLHSPVWVREKMKHVWQCVYSKNKR
jgi:hypothetical protein